MVLKESEKYTVGADGKYRTTHPFVAYKLRQQGLPVDEEFLSMSLRRANSQSKSVQGQSSEDETDISSLQ